MAINRGAEGKTGRYFVPNISEERAVELAARFISESFLFSVSIKPITRTVLHGALPRYLNVPACSAAAPADVGCWMCNVVVLHRWAWESFFLSTEGPSAML